MTQKNHNGHRQAQTTNLDAQVESLLETVQRRKDEQAAELAAQGYPPNVVQDLFAEHEALAKEVEAAQPRIPRQRRRRGVTAQRLIEQAQLTLLEGEQRGDYQQFPIEPGSEFPSIFTRVPIFVPTQRRTARAMLDDDGALHFETGWGKGRKFGPPLTIYDEDTLLALGALRQRHLVGMGHKLPVKVMNPFDPADVADVHVLYTTIGEIEQYLGAAKGGRGHKKRLASVKRLAAATIEFSRISDPRIKSAVRRQTFSTKIIDLLTEELTTDSCLYVQFPPVMVRWLKESYTYIDMDIRRQLSDNGKAVHKHLASQNTFNISVAKLRTVTGSALPMNRYLHELRATLSKLEQLGWLEYELDGNGRSRPYILKGRRLKKSAGAGTCPNA